MYPYRNHGLKKIAITFSVLGEEPPLRFLYLAQSRPYDCCIRRRTALTISVFGKEPPLRLLYSAKDRPYDFCIRQRTAQVICIYTHVSVAILAQEVLFQEGHFTRLKHIAELEGD